MGGTGRNFGSTFMAHLAGTVFSAMARRHAIYDPGGIDTRLSRPFRVASINRRALLVGERQASGADDTRTSVEYFQ